MKDKLIVQEDRGVYRIFWWLAEEQDLGAELGDGHEEGDDKHAVATRAAKTTPGVEKDSRSYYWESRSAASAALQIANAALKNKPLADWERKALAAGWKPPKERM